MLQCRQLVRLCLRNAQPVCRQRKFGPVLSDVNLRCTEFLKAHHVLLQDFHCSKLPSLEASAWLDGLELDIIGIESSSTLPISWPWFRTSMLHHRFNWKCQTNKLFNMYRVSWIRSRANWTQHSIVFDVMPTARTHFARTPEASPGRRSKAMLGT